MKMTPGRFWYLILVAAYDGLSVLTISGGQFIEQSKGGNMWLGGEDIDRKLESMFYRKPPVNMKLMILPQ